VHTRKPCTRHESNKSTGETEGRGRSQSHTLGRGVIPPNFLPVFRRFHLNDTKLPVNPKPLTLTPNP